MAAHFDSRQTSVAGLDGIQGDGVKSSLSVELRDRSPQMKGSLMLLYHGTGSRYLDGILRNGLRVRGDELDNQWPEANTRNDLVYLTKCFGPVFARHVCSGTDDRWLILEVSIDDTGRLMPDDAYGAVLSAYAGDPPNVIQTKERDYRTHLEDHRSEWESSLNTIGNVSCEASISIDDLKRYCLVDATTRPELVARFVEAVQTAPLTPEEVLPYFEQVTAWLFGDASHLPTPPRTANVAEIVELESANRDGIEVVVR